MKVSCSKTALVSGVRTVYKAVSQKATNLVLSGILVETTADGLRLVAYDLDLGIETFIPVQVEREGSFVFPAKQFADITGNLPHSEVILDYSESAGSVDVISEGPTSRSRRCRPRTSQSCPSWWRGRHGPCRSG